jgi:hypothetical protein
MSMSNSFSKAMTSSTVSRLSAAEVLHEARFSGELLALDAKLLDDDVLDLSLDLAQCHGPRSGSRDVSTAQMTMPPSTTSTWPVTYAARSDARKSTAPATSSGARAGPARSPCNKAAPRPRARRPSCRSR